MREQKLKGEEKEVNVLFIFLCLIVRMDFCRFLILYFILQIKRKLAEKAKNGTLKTNGEIKLSPKKRRRWDQLGETPKQKIDTGTTEVSTFWDNADVRNQKIF